MNCGHIKFNLLQISTTYMHFTRCYLVTQHIQLQNPFIVNREVALCLTIRRERMLVATIRTFPITGTSQRARVNKAITLSTPLLGLWSVSKVVVCWVMNEGIAPHHFYPPIPLSFFFFLFFQFSNMHHKHPHSGLKQSNYGYNVKLYERPKALEIPF